MTPGHRNNTRVGVAQGRRPILGWLSFCFAAGLSAQLEMMGEADNKMLELLLQRIMNGIESVATMVGVARG